MSDIGTIIATGPLTVALWGLQLAVIGWNRHVATCPQTETLPAVPQARSEVHAASLPISGKIGHVPAELAVPMKDTEEGHDPLNQGGWARSCLGDSPSNAGDSGTGPVATHNDEEPRAATTCMGPAARRRRLSQQQQQPPRPRCSWQQQRMGQHRAAHRAALLGGGAESGGSIQGAWP
ncbi:unnamed protein product [Lampetra fluviatilis]